MKKSLIPVILAALLLPASAALAGGRWDGGSSTGNRGYNYDRGARYSGGGGGGGYHSYKGGYHGGYNRGYHGYGKSYSGFSLGFSFGNSYGNYYGGPYRYGGYGSYGGYYRKAPTVVYRDTYYSNPPVRVYRDYCPPPVIYYPSPRVYYYDGCAPSSSFSVSGSYYYRK
jgi:hypothetical protein